MQLDIDQCEDWPDYQKALLLGRRSDFVDRVRSMSSVFSESELAVLCAALAAADYVWLADEIAGSSTWALLEHCDCSTRKVIAAAIARQ